MNRRNVLVNRMLRVAMPMVMVFAIGLMLFQYSLPADFFVSSISHTIKQSLSSVMISIMKESDFSSFTEELEENGRGGWVTALIARQFPGRYYKEKAKNSDKSKIEDPAYLSYLKNEAAYKDYEYMLREMGHDGESNEETQTEAVPPQETQPQDTPVQGTEVFTQAQTQLPVMGKTYVLEQLADYDFMMKHFYNIHPSTTAGRDMMKAETFLGRDFTLEQDSEKPQILIYHTHSQEEYADYAGGNKNATIVSVGEYLTQLLKVKGYNVIHDTTVYDLHNGELDRNKAYSYALDGVTAILQENPSIEVVLDVHRDGVKEGTHLISQVNEKPTAQIMFFNGLSQTPEGPIEYLQNPYKEDNLAFSFQMQLYSEAYFPGFNRKIYLKGLRYNQHLRPRSALIEVGAQTNTLNEALNAMEPLAELLDMVLQSK